jgi:hypothetical protein
MLIKALIHTSVTGLLFDICEGTKNKVEGILLKKIENFFTCWPSIFTHHGQADKWK